ncbi:MAG: hypothetical protein ABJC24_06705 [Chloroflexota bacterium]
MQTKSPSRPRDIEHRPARSSGPGRLDTPARRIVSLLPSATEIVCTLGLSDRLLAVSHECDFPPEAVAGLPRMTADRIPPTTRRSAEIDAAVRAALVVGHGLYALDEPLLLRLAPDLVLTQELCHVCAVSYPTVLQAARAAGGAGVPLVVSLEPHSLADVLATLELVATLAGVDAGRAGHRGPAGTAGGAGTTHPAHGRSLARVARSPLRAWPLGHPVRVAQAVATGPAQDAIDGRARVPGQRRQAGRAIPPAGSGQDDRRSRRIRQPTRRAVRPGAAILEPGQPCRPVAADPLVAGRAADAELLGDRRHRPAVDDHPLHQQLPTEDAETRTRMCHESLRPVWVVNTSHRAARLSFVNNVLKHHN